MISHEHQCIFVHIPKCAGSSIEKALNHYAEYDGRGKQNHQTIRDVEPIPLTAALSSPENILDLARRVRRNARKVHNPRNRRRVSREQYEQYFKFTIIRNPYARAFSWYKNVMSDPKHLQMYGISNDIQFVDFLSKFAGKGLLRPQLHWIRNFQGEVALDFVGRFENISNDFEIVKTKINAPDLELPHMLRGPVSRYHDYYCDKGRKIVSKIYEEELSLFEYSF